MKYNAVHYRIEAGYVWGAGMPAAKIAAFDKEVVELFVANGWTAKPKDSICSPEVVLGKNRLYLHPMEISGELQADLVPVVESIVKQGKTFKFVKTSITGVLTDLSDEEYTEQLKAKRAEIEEKLLSRLATKKGYISIPWAVEDVKEQYHVATLKHHIGRSCFDPEWKYVNDLAKELVAAGKIELDPDSNYRGRAA